VDHSARSPAQLRGDSAPPIHVSRPWCELQDKIEQLAPNLRAIATPLNAFPTILGALPDLPEPTPRRSRLHRRKRGASTISAGHSLPGSMPSEWPHRRHSPSLASNSL